MTGRFRMYLLKSHALLASFFLPLGIMFFVTGGLYTLEITGDYDPATLGSALHAVIATTLMGQRATGRVLADYGM